MRNFVAVLVALVVVVVIVWSFGSLRAAKAPGGGAEACTLEAKLCPDGSAVGRTGPNCEFAACPVATNTIAVGRSTTIGGTAIKVVSVTEDSRCPVDVQCVQAGTVRVLATVDASAKAYTFTLGQSQVVGNVSITLTSVIPAKYSKQTIQSTDYGFAFTVVPKSVTTTSGVKGIVSLGPTCPVQRNPPDPKCADKPYQTAVTVYREGTTSIVARGESDAKGAFQFALEPGSYTISAAGGTVLPRCTQVDVTVTSDAYSDISISCDTGIR